MCGIAGGVWLDPAHALSAETLGRMVAALRHRGPDDETVTWFPPRHGEGNQPRPTAVFGFRRLAIVDPDHGRQPFANEAGDLHLICNGEIYNRHELRRRLSGGGHVLRTRSDVEPLVHLYEDEGEDFLEVVSGMFALALWDARKRTLLLARDRLGEKPLYFHAGPAGLVFASELKSLLHVPQVPREIDPGSLDRYLTYGCVPAPRTIRRGVEQLRPGEILTWCPAGIRRRFYWRPNATLLPRAAPPAAAELTRLFDDSVARMLEADRPVGVFLSGGLDSSAVVAAAAAVSPEPLRTFSVGFEEPAFDERPAAAAVAAAFGTRHTSAVVTAAAWSDLPALATQWDEPFGDSSALPTRHLCRLAAADVKVALTGDGGDELFCGYPRHQAVAWAARLEPWYRSVPASWTDRLIALLPASGGGRSRLRQVRRFLEGLRLPSADRYAEWLSVFNAARRADLYTDEFIARLSDDPVDDIRAAVEPFRGRDAVSQAAGCDLVRYLPDDLLVKVDRASMAHGLECRCPFLDRRIVEFALSLPIELKLRGGLGKRILRAGPAARLPAAILKRPKQGFGIPLGAWFRGPWKEPIRELLRDPEHFRGGWFRREGVETLLREHFDGTFDHGARLWSLAMLETWRRIHAA